MNKLMIAAFSLTLASTVAAQSLYRTGFESSEGYAVGDLAAQSSFGWTAGTNTAFVVAATGGNPAADGSGQFVELNAGAALDKSFASLSTAGQDIWVEGWFRGAGSSSTLIQAVYPSEPASAIVHFSAASGIQLLNGDGNGSAITADRVVNSGVNLAASTWHKITLLLHFPPADQPSTNGTWDCYVDDAKVNNTALGFRDKSVRSLSGFRNLSETASGFDAFRVIKPLAGDANGDNLLDAADVVSIVDYASHASAGDPILRKNGDYSGDGQVTTDDALQLANRISAGS